MLSKYSRLSKSSALIYTLCIKETCTSIGALHWFLQPSLKSRILLKPYGYCKTNAQAKQSRHSKDPRYSLNYFLYLDAPSVAAVAIWTVCVVAMGVPHDPGFQMQLRWSDSCWTAKTAWQFNYIECHRAEVQVNEPLVYKYIYITLSHSLNYMINSGVHTFVCLWSTYLLHSSAYSWVLIYVRSIHIEAEHVPSASEKRFWQTTKSKRIYYRPVIDTVYLLLIML